MAHYFYDASKNLVVACLLLGIPVCESFTSRPVRFQREIIAPFGAHYLSKTPRTRLQISSGESIFSGSDESNFTGLSSITTEGNNERFQNQLTYTTEPSSSAIAFDHSEDAVTAAQSIVLETPSEQQQAKDREIMWARLLLIGAAALYGTNFSLVKLMGESELPVGLSTTLRFGMAALATSPWLFAKPKTPSVEGELSPAIGAVLGGLEVGMWNSIGYLSQAVGLETTLASKSAFLCSLAVVVVPFLEWISGRRLKSREWVGAALALAGVAFLELGEAGAGNILTSWSSGDLISMIQPFAFGLGFYKMERAMQRYPNEANRCTAGQLLATFMSAAVFCAVTEGGHEWTWGQLQTWLSDPTLLAFLAWTGVASTALSVYMETIALKTLSAAETTLLLSTEPLWGAGWAAIIIGEQFGLDAAIGSLMVLVGCLYSNLGMEGIQSLLRIKVEKKITNEVKSQPLAINADKSSANGALGVSAMLAAAHIAGAWNNLSIGARVIMLQLQDLVEEFL